MDEAKMYFVLLISLMIVLFIIGVVRAVSPQQKQVAAVSGHTHDIEIESPPDNITFSESPIKNPEEGWIPVTGRFGPEVLLIRDGQLFMVLDSNDFKYRLYQGQLKDKIFTYQMVTNSFRTLENGAVETDIDGKTVRLNYIHSRFFSPEPRSRMLTDLFFIATSPHPHAREFKPSPYPNYPSLAFEFPSAANLKDGEYWYLHPDHLENDTDTGSAIAGWVMDGIFRISSMKSWLVPNKSNVIGPNCYGVSIHRRSIAFHWHSQPEHANHIEGPYYSWRSREHSINSSS